MRTDRKITAVQRSRTAGASRPAPPPERPGDDPAAAAATAGPAHDPPMTVQRRFRRGRWTLTSLPA